LKHFAGTKPERMVWTYDKRGGEPRPSLPKETGAESNFYSVIDKDGENNDAVEHWLAGVESKAAPIYGRVLNGEIPTGQDRADFSTFIASLHVRTPAQLRKAGEMIGHTTQAITQLLTASPERFQKGYNRIPGVKPIDMEMAKKACEFANDSETHVLHVDRAATLMALGASDKLQQILFDMGWFVIGSDQHTFVTSDHPVLHRCPKESFHPILGNGGFLNKKVEVSLPLAPNRCLILRWGQDWPGVHPASREVVFELNRVRALFAERFLYAHRRDEGARALTAKYKDLRDEFRLLGLGENRAPVEVKRRLQTR
jgi:hypothetical protein